LIALEVDDAGRAPSGVWCATYSPGRHITSRAVIDPPGLGPPSDIVWQGGDPDSPYRRVVRLGKLTPFGESWTVQATLGSVTKSVYVKVVPRLLRVDVSGAERTADGTWRVNTDGAPVVVRATTAPSVFEAWPYLQWTGTEPCSDSDDNSCRLVQASAFTDPDRLLLFDVRMAID
jgi:hypothetical protein